MMFIFGVILLCSCAWHSLGQDKPWNYDKKGPDTWSTFFPEFCAGRNQSPINIPTSGSKLKQMNGADQVIGFSSNYILPIKGTLLNNGRMAVFNLDANTGDPVLTTTKAGLSDTYQLASIHFHWGKDSTSGSEHQIDSKSFAGEIHLIHFKKQYADVPTALASKDVTALAVLAFFFEISASDNTNWLPITDALGKITAFNTSTPVTKLNIRNSLPLKLGNWYYYNGSLTTPNCNEQVVFVVFNDTIQMSEAQMGQFRKLSSEDGLIQQNCRPVQELMTRKVWYYTLQPVAANTATGTGYRVLVGMIAGLSVLSIHW